jgi:hypothetical protein
MLARADELQKILDKEAANKPAAALSRPKRDDKLSVSATGAFIRNNLNSAGRRRKSVGSVEKLEYANELSQREKRSIQRNETLIAEQMRAARFGAQIEAQDGKYAARQLIGDTRVTSNRVDAKTIAGMSLIDAYAHQKLVDGATVISRDEALNRELIYGDFPGQRTPNKVLKQNMGELINIRTVTTTIAGFFDKVCRLGYSYLPNSFDKAAKSTKTNTVCRSDQAGAESYFYSLWLDFDEPGITIDMMRKLCDKRGLLYYETASSTAEWRKFRVGMLLAQPLRAPHVPNALTVMETLCYAELGVVDDFKTRNLSRLFYGRKDGDYYIPAQVHLYTITAKMVEDAVKFREAFVVKRVMLGGWVSTGDAFSVDIDALAQNIIKMGVDPKYGTRTKGTDTYGTFRTLLFALGDLARAGYIAEEDAEALWQNNFDDPNNELAGLWEAGMKEPTTNNPVTMRSLGFMLREVLGEAFVNFMSGSSKRAPYNLSPCEVPDLVYDDKHGPELAFPGTMTLDISITGAGKTHRYAAMYSDPADVIRIKEERQVDDIYILCTSLYSNSASEFIQMTSALTVEGRQIMMYRCANDIGWTTVTDALENDPEIRAYIEANMDNKELVRKSNDSRNVLMHSLYAKGYSGESATAHVMPATAHVGESDYAQTNRLALGNNSKNGRVIVTTPQKFMTLYRTKLKKDPTYTAIIVVDEYPTWESMYMEQVLVQGSQLASMPNLGPAGITLMNMLTGWFDHLHAVEMSNIHCDPSFEAFKHWATANSPAGLQLLQINGNITAILGDAVDTINKSRLDSWLDDNAKIVTRMMSMTKFMNSLAIADTRIVQYLHAFAAYLKTNESPCGCSYDKQLHTVSMGRMVLKPTDLINQNSITVLSANQRKEPIVRNLNIKVRTVAHKDFHGNALMQNMRFTQVTVGGLNNHTLAEHTIKAIQMVDAVYKPTLIANHMKHNAQIAEHLDLTGRTATHHGGVALTGSNKYKDENCMMMIGLPIDNIGGMRAKLHTMLQRKPSDSELRDYCHAQTENKIMQEFGRLRGNRRQDQELRVIILTGKHIEFIAPVNQTEFDYTDESIYVERNELHDNRSTTEYVFTQIRQMLEDCQRAGESRPLIVDLATYCGCCETTIAKAIKNGGYAGITEMYTAITAMLAAEKVAETEVYIEQRASLLSQMREWEAEAVRTRRDKLAMALELAGQTFEPADMYMSCNQFIHDLFPAGEHAALLHEWADYTDGLLLSDHDRAARMVERLNADMPTSPG